MGGHEGRTCKKGRASAAPRDLAARCAVTGAHRERERERIGYAVYVSSRNAHAAALCALAHVSTAEKRLGLIEFALPDEKNFGGTTRPARSGSKATASRNACMQPDMRRHCCSGFDVRALLLQALFAISREKNFEFHSMLIKNATRFGA